MLIFDCHWKRYFYTVLKENHLGKLTLIHLKYVTHLYP